MNGIDVATSRWLNNELGVNFYDWKFFQWFNSWAGISLFWDWFIISRAVYLLYFMIFVMVLLAVSGFFPRWREYKKKNLEAAFFALFSGVIARFVFAEIIRFFYSRPRPFEVIEGARQLVDHASGGSFPSGHASFAFGVAAGIVYYYPKTSILFFLAAFSIGIGRVAAGVHWPSDVLGGAIVGIGSALALKWIWSLYKK